MAFNKTIREFDQATNHYTVHFSGVNIWPYLRYYTLDKLHFNTDRKPKVDASKGLSLLKLIFYGFSNWFGSYDAIIFNVTGDRKLYNGKWTGKSDFIAPYLGKSLMIELTRDSHRPIKEIPSQHVVSKIPMLAIEKIAEKFIRVPPEVLEIERELKSMYQIETNLGVIYKQFVVRYHMTRYLIGRFKPKVAEVNAAYVDMPRVMALKEAGVKVIEMQHGTINADHHGYQLYNQYSELLFPDYLLCFGTSEKDFFKGSTYIDESKVTAVGSFYMEYINQQQLQSDELDQIRKKHKVVIAATGQDAYDDQLIPFLRQVMNKRTDWACVYIPRTENAEFYKSKFDLPSNLYFINDLNTYQTIRLADVHTTVNSTCALESLALGTPNVLFNYSNKSKAYFPQLQSDEESNAFANEVDAYIQAVEGQLTLSSEQVIQQSIHLFVPEFTKNIQSFFEHFD